MGYSRSVLLVFCLANVCISYAQEPPRFRVLETPAGVRIDALSNNGHLVGNREGYGVFEW